jgi:hypothetical protein
MGRLGAEAEAPPTATGCQTKPAATAAWEDGLEDLT